MEFLTDLKRKVSTIPLQKAIAVFGIFLLGGLSVFSMRFILVDKKDTHYHANFAVYVNGERENFDGPTFYEEVASCSVSKANPRALAHMHDQVSDVVHVHSDSATWGLFFENLSYSVSREALLTDDGLFVDSVDGKKLTYILNGQTVPNIAGRVIGSEDVLIVDYGSRSIDQIKASYDQINRDAGEYNLRDDPSSCTGGKTEPFKDRLLRTIGIDA